MPAFFAQPPESGPAQMGRRTHGLVADLNKMATGINNKQLLHKHKQFDTVRSNPHGRTDKIIGGPMYKEWSCFVADEWCAKNGHVFLHLQSPETKTHLPETKKKRMTQHASTESGPAQNGRQTQ